MCRTAHAVLSVLICGIQMLVRVFMTTILMLENIFRMILQTFYNFLSFMLQLLSLIPICCVFLVTSRLKCFMCGGGGPCPVSRGGACDCLMSLFAIIILFFIFRATGVLDKIFFSIGYAKATTNIVRFVPTTGSITECSRNDTDTEYVFYPLDTTATNLKYFYIDDDDSTEIIEEKIDELSTLNNMAANKAEGRRKLVMAENSKDKDENKYDDVDDTTFFNTPQDINSTDMNSTDMNFVDWTTVLYYVA
ncbi:hypothetical protein O0L34_g7461 [Tuta absoluta]|nr:hypothetical protein O0L34_g7461 [Tuta absoluta]